MHGTYKETKVRWVGHVTGYSPAVEEPGVEGRAGRGPPLRPPRGGAALCSHHGTEEVHHSPSRRHPAPQRRQEGVGVSNIFTLSSSRCCPPSRPLDLDWGVL